MTQPHDPHAVEPPLSANRDSAWVRVLVCQILGAIGVGLLVALPLLWHGTGSVATASPDESTGMLAAGWGLVSGGWALLVGFAPMLVASFFKPGRSRRSAFVLTSAAIGLAFAIVGVALSAQRWEHIALAVAWFQCAAVAFYAPHLLLGAFRDPDR